MEHINKEKLHNSVHTYLKAMELICGTGYLQVVYNDQTN